MEGNWGFLGALDRFNKAVTSVHGQIETCHQHLERLITSTFNSSEARVQEILNDLQPIFAHYANLNTRARFLVQTAKHRNEYLLQVALKVVQDKISLEEAGNDFISELNHLLLSLNKIMDEHYQLIQSLQGAIDVSHKTTRVEGTYGEWIAHLQSVLTYTAVMSLVVAVVAVGSGVREALMGEQFAKARAIVGGSTAVERLITCVGALLPEVAVGAVIALWARMASHPLPYTGALAVVGAFVTAGTRKVVKLIPMAGIVVPAGLVGAISFTIKEWVKPHSECKDNNEHKTWILMSAGITKELVESEKSIKHVIRDLANVHNFLKTISIDMKNPQNHRAFVTKSNFKFMIESIHAR